MNKKRLLLIGLLILFSVSSILSVNSSKIHIGDYNGDNLYVDEMKPFNIVKKVQKTLIETDKFKEKYPDRYKKIVDKYKKQILFNKKFSNKSKKYKSEFIKRSSYTYDLQHIYLLNEDTFEKLKEMRKQLSTFSGFSKIAKEYSMEEQSKRRNALMMNVNLQSHKISNILYYSFYNKKVNELIFTKDIYGYHIFKIVRKKDFNISKKLKNMEKGIKNYIVETYYQKLYKENNVKIDYSAVHNFFKKSKDALIYEVNGNKITKEMLLNEIPSKIRNNKFQMMKFKVTSIVPLLQSNLRERLLKYEIKNITLDNKMRQKADDEFKDEIFNKWMKTTFDNIKIENIDEKKLKKVYKSRDIPKIERKKIAMIQFEKKSNMKEIEKKIKTEKDFKDYIKKFPHKVHYSPFLSNSKYRKYPKNYKKFKKYLNKEVGTILPVDQFGNNYIIPMVYKKSNDPVITYITYKKRVNSIKRKKEFYKKIIDSWKSNDKLFLKKDIYEKFEKLIKEIDLSAQKMVKINK